MKYCPLDPYDPESNDLLSSWDKASYSGGKTPFGSIVTYECGEGRQFKSVNGTGNINWEQFQTFSCLWNQSWAPKDPVN